MNDFQLTDIPSVGATSNYADLPAHDYITTIEHVNGGAYLITTGRLGDGYLGQMIVRLQVAPARQGGVGWFLVRPSRRNDTGGLGQVLGVFDIDKLDNALNRAVHAAYAELH
jgi:hypothetical protein